jgi:hypothetical protein
MSAIARGLGAVQAGVRLVNHASARGFILPYRSVSCLTAVSPALPAAPFDCSEKTYLSD